MTVHLESFRPISRIPVSEAFKVLVDVAFVPTCALLACGSRVASMQAVCYALPV